MWFCGTSELEKCVTYPVTWYSKQGRKYHMKQTIPPLYYLCRRRPLGLEGVRESSVDNHLEVPDSKSTIVKGRLLVAVVCWYPRSTLPFWARILSLFFFFGLRKVCPLGDSLTRDGQSCLSDMLKASLSRSPYADMWAPGQDPYGPQNQKLGFSSSGYSGIFDVILQKKTMVSLLPPPPLHIFFYLCVLWMCVCTR